MNTLQCGSLIIEAGREGQVIHHWAGGVRVEFDGIGSVNVAAAEIEEVPGSDFRARHEAREAELSRIMRKDSSERTEADDSSFFGIANEIASEERARAERRKSRGA